jgi:hypothetical protein
MKTAVEWIAEQYNLVDTAEYAQAKEMEKEQIIDAYAQGFIESERMDKGAYQYYNETFKTINNG